MSPNIVQARTFLTLLGGAPTHLTLVKQALDLAPVLVAADGGADTALAAGQIPRAVIGDMDSVSEAARAQIGAGRLYHIAEQDSTDFAKCLRLIEAPVILAVGFSGGRLDHQLAACSTLVEFGHKRVVMMGQEDICFLCPPKLVLDLTPGARISLFPMAPVSGRGSGLKHPIDGLAFAPDGQIGTSNEATGQVTLSFNRPAMLVIVARDALGAVLDALADGTEPGLT